MKKMIFSILAALLFLGSTQAQAISYNLNTWNHDAVNADYGTVTITEDAAGTISFVIAAGSFFTSNPANDELTFDKFDFNYKGSVALDNSKFSFGSTPGTWKVTNGGNASSFGIFDDQSKGTGIGAATINPLTFYYNGTAGDSVSVDDFVDYSTNHSEFTDYYFAAHLRRIDAPADLDGSVWLASTEPGGSTPVPEPGTLMLLGIGMFSLAVYGKRRMNREP
jgi:hypothetical protein